jgi:anti-sigma regulatory factor (Ser/Thr protein kinase)
MVRKVTDDAENARVALVVTELVTNAVHHCGAAPLFTVECNGAWIRVEVYDDGPGRPVVRELDAEATSGRGLALVEAVADRWGVDDAPGGKTVWAEIGLVGLDLGG